MRRNASTPEPQVELTSHQRWRETRTASFERDSQALCKSLGLCVVEHSSKSKASGPKKCKFQSIFLLILLTEWLGLKCFYIFEHLGAYFVILKTIIDKLSFSNAQLKLGPENFTNNKRTADEVLVELSMYGNPKLLKTPSGWWCFIEVFDANVGSKRTIESEIFHRQPGNAISECLERTQTSGIQKRHHS